MLLLSCLLLLAWGVRFGVASLATPFRLVGDERYFARVATNIAAGHGHQLTPSVRAWRPPAFSYVLAAVPAHCADLVRQMYEWQARNCELLFCQVRGRFQPFHGVSMPNVMLETG